jgi:hypothetical protein
MDWKLSHYDVVLEENWNNLKRDLEVMQAGGKPGTCYLIRRIR